MAVEDYKPGRYEYPIDDRDRYNAKIQFEIIKTNPPTIRGDFKSLLKWKREGDQDIDATGNPVDPPETKSLKASGYQVDATGKKVDLYVPQAHTVTDVFSYNNAASLGIAGAGFLNTMQQGGSVAQAASTAMKEGFIKGVDDVLKAFGGQALTQAAAVRAASFAPIPQGVRDAVGLIAQASIHPNLRTTFSNVGIRQFTFQFKFIPRSRDEAVVVKQIINYFRFHAYPEELPIGGAIPIAYKYPDMFRIKLFSRVFENGNLRYVPIGSKLLDCFLNSITVTTNPTAGVYHYDGEPIETDLTLNFMEHRPLARSDIEKPLGFATNEQAQQQSGSF